MMKRRKEEKKKRREKKRKKEVEKSWDGRWERKENNIENCQICNTEVNRDTERKRVRERGRERDGKRGKEKNGKCSLSNK